MTAGRPVVLYNSLGRRTQEFRPSSRVVGIFSCGPLVLAHQHLGILRAYVCVDLLRRALHWKGLPTRHIVMITDVAMGHDGHTEAAVPADPAAMRSSELYMGLFLADLAAMNVLRADAYPRVSAHISEAIAFAEVLQRRAYAYPAEGGLCFDTGKVGDYGALALMDVSAQRVGAEVRPGRRNKTDFALWRLAGTGGQGIGWDSPWGRGLPGAHLSCSAIATKLLGPHFDVHTGGKHHRQLHHVNEIAQSEAYLGDGQPWVRYWMHYDHLTMGGKPMVRGSAPCLSDLVSAGTHPMAYRFLVLRSHYRRNQAYSGDALAAARKTLWRLVARAEPLGRLPVISTYAEAAAQICTPAAATMLDRLDAAICTDLHSPKALAVLHEMLRVPDLTMRERGILVAAADAVLGLNLTSLRLADLSQPSPAERP